MRIKRFIDGKLRDELEKINLDHLNLQNKLNSFKLQNDKKKQEIFIETRYNQNIMKKLQNSWKELQLFLTKSKYV